jgi:Trypsin-co-occurring domain 1
MSKTMLVELPSGKKLLFGGPEKGGLHEVSLKDQLATKTSGQFETALGTLGELVGVLEKTVGGLVHRPSKVEMEFGATLSADCDLWVVSGKGEAEFKVTLSWDADGKTGT